jgi:hypothetical protein
MLSVFLELDGFSKDRCSGFHGSGCSKRYDSKQVQGFRDHWISNLIIYYYGNCCYLVSEAEKILDKKGKGYDFQRDSILKQAKKRKPHGWSCGVFIETETLTVF